MTLLCTALLNSARASRSDGSCAHAKTQGEGEAEGRDTEAERASEREGTRKERCEGGGASTSVSLHSGNYCSVAVRCAVPSNSSSLNKLLSDVPPRAEESLTKEQLEIERLEVDLARRLDEVSRRKTAFLESVKGKAAEQSAKVEEVVRTNSGKGFAPERKVQDDVFHVVKKKGGRRRYVYFRPVYP
eukprot:SAG11_NODE_259_length_11534_cov_3.402361_6_plen_187_part_00